VREHKRVLHTSSQDIDKGEQDFKEAARTESRIDCEQLINKKHQSAIFFINKKHWSAIFPYCHGYFCT
jgi:hypothetical protein